MKPNRQSAHEIFSAEISRLVRFIEQNSEDVEDRATRRAVAKARQELLRTVKKRDNLRQRGEARK